MPEKIIVTSALPYANGPIHFGQIVGAYLPADVYVRFRRMLGDDVHYVCGTDEHGVAITLKAEQQGEDYERYVDRWHAEIARTLQAFDIRFDVFSGTAHHRNPFHGELSQQFFTDLLGNGYLIERTEEQYYSATAGRFLPDRYIEGTCYLCGYQNARGDECPSCGKYLDAKKLIEPRSTLDGSEPVLRDSKHWYLDLAKARDEWLREWFESKRGQWKPNVENFVRGDLDELRERPITRDLPWGVPVPLPGTAGKVLYVWFDAPIGYLSISKQHWTEQGRPERFEELWKDPETKLYHFLGKDNITFHAVVFPAILRGADRGWILPENIPANEFLNLEGRKFNTTAGWFIREETVLPRFPVDALRYALCTMMPEAADAEFTWAEFQSRVNHDLADNLGNFVSRTMRFIERFFDGVVPARGAMAPQDEALLEAARAAARDLQANLHAFSFRKACQTLMGLGSECNRYYDTEQPWVTVKREGADGIDRCRQTMRMCAEMIRSLAVLSAPIMPNTAATLLAALGIDDPPRFDQVGAALADGPLRGLPLTAGLPKFEDEKGRQKSALFRKVPDAFVEERLAELRTMATPADTGASPDPQSPDPQSPDPQSPDPQAGREPVAPEIDYERFSAVDLRAGTVRAASEHPKADRLLVLEVDLGFEVRTVVAGIAASYKATELVDQRVVVVANLAPRKLRGVTSQGMILAADDSAGKPRLVQPAAGTPDGARVR